LVVVLGDPRFYKRFGFEAAEHAGIAAPPELPPAALQIRRLSGYRPDVKGTIQFPPVFAATGTL
jgi:putative acetyltransferase